MSHTSDAKKKKNWHSSNQRFSQCEDSAYFATSKKQSVPSPTLQDIQSSSWLFWLARHNTWSCVQQINKTDSTRRKKMHASKPNSLTKMKAEKWLTKCEEKRDSWSVKTPEYCFPLCSFAGCFAKSIKSCDWNYHQSFQTFEPIVRCWN